MIQAKVIADSTSSGNRITTMVVTMPRIILAEFNTHRMFSRNSASSRAIPFEKMVESVKNNPFIPIAWQRDHKGMQGSEYTTNNVMLEYEWLEARNKAIIYSESLCIGNDVTKQLCNRLLEPFMWHTVIVTATEWENFFHLRCPQYVYDGFGARSVKDIIGMCKRNQELDIPFSTTNDATEIENSSILERLKHNKGQAEIHMMALAEAMWDALNESTPKELKAGEWHIPFGNDMDEDKLRKLQRILSDLPEGAYTIKAGDQSVHTGKGGRLLFDNALMKEVGLDPFWKLKVAIATARCARVSYTVVGEEDKPANYENDIKLHDRLAASGHWSPFEHCARVPVAPELEETGWSGNFKGFIQYRKTFAHENITKHE